MPRGAGDFIESIVITLPPGSTFDPGTGFSFGPVFASGVGLAEADVEFVVAGGSDTLTINFDPGTFAVGDSFSFGIDTDPGSQGADDIEGASFEVILEDASTAAATFVDTGVNASAATAEIPGHGDPDTITDFEVGVDGDVLDIADVFDVDTSTIPGDIGNFVNLTALGGDTVVQVDANGGGDSFTDLVVLQGVSSVTVTDLLTQGNLDVIA